MNWKLFVVEMTHAIAWPLTIGLIALFMKDSISDLALRILKLRHKDTEIEFSETMSSLKERAETAILSEDDIEPDLKEEKNRLEKLSSVVPRSALHQAWGLVDREVGDYLLESEAEAEAEAEGISLNASDVFRRIKDIGLRKSDLKNFIELREIMKSVALPSPNDLKLEKDEVDSYIELAVDVAHSMREARSNKALQRTKR